MLLSALLQSAAKPGYRTTEFWRGILLKGMAIAAVLFHRDLTGTARWIPLAATVLAGAETVIYTIGRNGWKKALFTGVTLSAHDYGDVNVALKTVGADTYQDTTVDTPESPVDGSTTEDSDLDAAALNAAS